MRRTPIGERIDSVEGVARWTDHIPLSYQYTAGVAGERFLRRLREGKVEAARCERCGRAYLPPKMYCVECFVEIRSYVEVKKKGRVAALCSSHYDEGGKRLERPRVFVYVTFEGVSGGMLHRVVSGSPRIGSSAVAVFRPESERVGSILDIEGFSTSP